MQGRLTSLSATDPHYPIYCTGLHHPREGNDSEEIKRRRKKIWSDQ